MSMFFATPMYGGQCTAQFHKSAMLTAEELTKQNIPYEWATLYNESLITRARNNLVAAFMSTDLDVLMFIDADIEFSPHDIAKLWNLSCEGNGVVVGAYPMKRPDKPCSAWVEGRLVNLDTLSGITKIDLAGTGFMMIRRDALELMMERFPEAKYEDHGEKYALFDTSIEDGVYLSEDYTFCSRYRSIGGEITLDPSIILNHIGTFTYGDK